ncbi:MAG: phosphatidylinositol-specific phospholipase C/glycerophosphodiester phosphodiesterase family protein [Massilibacteroides sp.]|nr:phosphatidylinositol-specific phospholipase C/glycerophosphodiester phosphodiesterase family protein [Massilibacteroides sp.]MDD3063363.1 phosphatidylinositol-specific phospholipase C/glycerophosphodiester phosphodiesterase family protein [Massilibacteroides sp.]MDD4114350.1 phosphatidylinositol-specific phospholipase C/glycerophosphodiester phosphodiesterase family protein [Massilibacteroides sp.]MDD4659693.1 phosphatidylinositol-specific phospholipase C/glycerophosphodiester phosphodiestera
MSRIIFFFLVLAGFNVQAQQVHYNAFSHNDYWRNRPLFDALDYGFNCVEADLWLIDGELYVAHDRPEPKMSIVFSNLYLKPLIARIQKNGGKVYLSGDRPFYLMIDCKTNGEEMYPLLKRQLEPYKKYFCSVENGCYKEGAVLLFFSGNRPRKAISEETSRIAFLDGTIADLGKEIPKTLMPVVSDNFSAFFSWRGEGNISEKELNEMRAIIRQVHEEGKLFRWWGAPDTPLFKRFFREEGVDLIGADDLRGLHEVLK